MSDLKSAPSKFCLKIRKLLLFDLKYPNLGIRARNLKSESNRKFQISAIVKFWVVSGRFAIFWGRFRWFQVVWLILASFGSFWLVPDFSKYLFKNKKQKQKEKSITRVLVIMTYILVYNKCNIYFSYWLHLFVFLWHFES